LSFARQYQFKFDCVFFCGSFRPQRFPKARELMRIGRPRLSDADFHHSSISAVVGFKRLPVATGLELSRCAAVWVLAAAGAV